MVPKIRIKGFGGEWLNYSLAQITDVYDGTHQTPAYAKSGVMFLSAENIKTLTSKKFISEAAFKKDFNVYPQKNDVLMTRIGDVGTANVVETDDDKAYYVTLALLKHKQLSPYFLKNSIASPYVQRDIWLRTLHIAFPKKINMNEIKQVLINCPSDTLESDEIGNTFQKLDSLINQHQQKHDKLSSIKKAMLEKMFPKQGKTIPEIRFNGFRGEWEEKIVSQLGEVVTGSTPSTQSLINYSNDGLPWITPTDISKNITFNSAKKLSEVGCKLARIVPKNTILVTCIASIGKNTILGAKGSFNQQINGVIPNEKDNFPYFLFAASILWSENLKRSAASGTMQIVNKTEFSELKTLVPKKDEQIKIGDYFKKLDELINQHQQQITKLNNIKQACLSKMFV